MRREIGLAEAAQRLAIPYQDAHRLLLTGKLRGEKRGGRWWVPSADVDRLRHGDHARTEKMESER